MALGRKGALNARTQNPKARSALRAWAVLGFRAWGLRAYLGPFLGALGARSQPFFFV